MEHSVSRLGERLEGVARDVQSIMLAIKGDPAIGTAGLVPRLESLERKIDAANLTEISALKVKVANLETALLTAEKAQAYQLGKHAGISAVVAMIITLLAAWWHPSPAPAVPPSIILQTPAAAPAAVTPTPAR